MENWGGERNRADTFPTERFQKVYPRRTKKCHCLWFSAHCRNKKSATAECEREDVAKKPCSPDVCFTPGATGRTGSFALGFAVLLLESRMLRKWHVWFGKGFCCFTA